MFTLLSLSLCLIRELLIELNNMKKRRNGFSINIKYIDQINSDDSTKNKLKRKHTIISNDFYFIIFIYYLYILLLIFKYVWLIQLVLNDVTECENNNCNILFFLFTKLL